MSSPYVAPRGPDQHEIFERKYGSLPRGWTRAAKMRVLQPKRRGRRAWEPSFPADDKYSVDGPREIARDEQRYGYRDRA